MVQELRQEHVSEAAGEQEVPLQDETEGRAEQEVAAVDLACLEGEVQVQVVPRYATEALGAQEVVTAQSAEAGHATAGEAEVLQAAQVKR